MCAKKPQARTVKPDSAQSNEVSTEFTEDCVD